MSETKNVIFHGDSRLTIPKIKTPINCVITDPPYGMAFVSNRAVTPEGKKLNEAIEGDGTPEEALETFASIMAAIVPKLADEADLYVFTAWHVLDHWIPAVKAIHPDIILKQMLFWEKGYPGQGDLEANWGCGHEVILYLKKGRRPVPFRRSGIFHINADIDAEIARQEWYLDYLRGIKSGNIDPGVNDLGYIPVDKIPAGQNIHPTEKPVELLEWLVKASTNKGDLIVDPYSGSGSTSVAAQRLGRNSLAFELKESYVLKSRQRLAQTGFAFE